MTKKNQNNHLEQMEPQKVIKDFQIEDLGNNLCIDTETEYSLDSIQNNKKEFGIETKVFNFFNRFFREITIGIKQKILQIIDAFRANERKAIELRNDIESYEIILRSDIEMEVSAALQETAKKYKAFYDIEQFWQKFKTKFSLMEAEPQKTKPYSKILFFVIAMLASETFVNAQSFYEFKNSFSVISGGLLAFTISLLNTIFSIAVGYLYFKKFQFSFDKTKEYRDKIKKEEKKRKRIQYSFCFGAFLFHLSLGFLLSNIVIVLIGSITTIVALFEGYFRHKPYVLDNMKYDNLSLEYHKKKNTYEKYCITLQEQIWISAQKLNKDINKKFEEIKEQYSKTLQDITTIENNLLEYKETAITLQQWFEEVIVTYRGIFTNAFRIRFKIFEDDTLNSYFKFMRSVVTCDFIETTDSVNIKNDLDDIITNEIKLQEFLQEKQKIQFFFDGGDHNEVNEVNNNDNKQNFLLLKRKVFDVKNKINNLASLYNTNTKPLIQTIEKEVRAGKQTIDENKLINILFKKNNE